MISKVLLPIFHDLNNGHITAADNVVTHILSAAKYPSKIYLQAMKVKNAIKKVKNTNKAAVKPDVMKNMVKGVDGQLKILNKMLLTAENK